MRVLMDAVAFQNDFQRGIQRAFYQLISHINRSVDVDLFVDGPLRASVPDNCSITFRWEQARIRRSNLPLRAWNKFRRKFLPTRLPRPDIFHSTYFTLSPFPDVPQIVTVHDMIPELHGDLCDDWVDQFRSVKARALEAATLIIAISHSTAADLGTVFPETKAKTRVIHHGADHLLASGSAASQGARSGVSGPFALFVGDRSQYKNFAAVRTALKSTIWPQNLPLVIVGPPLSPEERAELERRNVLAKITDLGRVDDVQLAALYRDCLAFIFPSLAEGFGFPLIEAQANSAPVICSDIPVFHEIGADSVFYFDTGNPSMIGETLQRLLDDRALRQRFQEAGKLNVRRFSWDACAEATIKTYHEAMQIGPARDKTGR